MKAKDLFDAFITVAKSTGLDLFMIISLILAILSIGINILIKWDNYDNSKPDPISYSEPIKEERYGEREEKSVYYPDNYQNN